MGGLIISPEDLADIRRQCAELEAARSTTAHVDMALASTAAAQRGILTMVTAAYRIVRICEQRRARKAESAGQK